MYSVFYEEGQKNYLKTDAWENQLYNLNGRFNAVSIYHQLAQHFS